MRSTHLGTLLATATLGLTAASADAQNLVDVTALNVRPIVMLLVDTSGSMERSPTTTTCDECLPTCDSALASNDTRNRWSVTLEALTGTMNGFSCDTVSRTSLAKTEPDYGYHIPHFAPAYTDQNPDGLLDNYGTDAMFAFMTFDPTPTWVDVPDFSIYSDVNDPADTDRVLFEGARGSYSYGQSRPLAFPGCGMTYGVDTGSRGASAPNGNLITVAASDDATSLGNVATQIQNSLLAIRPYGGTPIAGMLTDFRYWLQNEPLIQIGNDPYAECRPRYAILITDGAPDDDFRKYGCETACDPLVNPSAATLSCCNGGPDANADMVDTPCCPYQHPSDVAHDLCVPNGAGTSCSGDLDKLFVVALDVNDPVGVAELNQIAAEGGSGSTFLAGDLGTLQAQLSSIVAGFGGSTTTRTVPVTVDNGASLASGGDLVQFQLSAGVEVLPNNQLAGRITRLRKGCVGDVASTSYAPEDPEGNDTGNVHGSDALDVAFNAMDDSLRAIATVLPGAGGSALGTVLGNYSKRDASMGTPTSLCSGGVYSDTINNNGGSAALVASDGSGLGSSACASSYGNQVDFAVGGALQSALMPYVATLDVNQDSIVGNSSDAAYVVSWIRGEVSQTDPLRYYNKLGGILKSQPVTLTAPVGNTIDFLLNDFRELQPIQYPGASALTLQQTPSAIIAGTTDGIIHGIALDNHDLNLDGNVDGISSSGIEARLEPLAGQELWGFVPPAVIPSLAAAISTPMTLVNGSPVVEEVELYTTGAGQRDVTRLRRVMIMGLAGAAAYVALDVTDTRKPQFMWQFSHGGLGNTVGRPAIAMVGIGGDKRAVAILPGGDGEFIPSGSGCNAAVGSPGSPGTGMGPALNPANRRSVYRCWKQRGRQLFVLDLSSGKVLSHFDHRAFNAPLSGAVITNKTDALSLSTAAYLSDEEGVVWRLNLSSTTPSSWRVEPWYDMFFGITNNSVNPTTPHFSAGRPAKFPMVMSRDQLGNVALMQATGDIDSTTDTAIQRVISVSEAKVYDTFGNVTGVVPTLNWALSLPPGEQVAGPLKLLDDSVYFSTFIPFTDPTDQCPSPSSRLWGAKIATAAGSDSQFGHPTPAPALVDASSPTGLSLFSNLGAQTVMGVQIEAPPACETASFSGSAGGTTSGTNLLESIGARSSSPAYTVAAVTSTALDTGDSSTDSSGATTPGSSSGAASNYKTSATTTGIVGVQDAHSWEFQAKVVGTSSSFE